MSRSNDPISAEALAKAIDSLLRQQPLRPAPESLQARVMASIQQQHGPTVRAGFVHWPLAARIVFVALSAVMIKLAIDVSMFLVQSIAVSVSMPKPPLAVRLAEALLLVSKHLPTLWLYGGTAVLIVVYGSLFGVSAAAYRTLYVQR
jgi:hypothetical protein